MAARPPRAERRRRPRGATLERPINARMYRGTWLLVGIPLLLASLGVSTPTTLPRPVLPSTFDRASAVDLARELATAHPNREPGTPAAAGATRWVVDHLRVLGLNPERRPFVARIPGRGDVRLVNVVARIPGRSADAIAVVAHRDNAGVSAGADDNASGTAVLLELARTYAFLAADDAAPSAATVEPPAHTLLFISTDGGAHGAIGAAELASRPAYRERVAAAIVLDAVGGARPPRLQVAGDVPRSPPPELVESLSARLLEEAERRPERPSVVSQLTDLAFPLNLYEQAPLVAAGIPAVTLTTGDDAAAPEFGDSPAELAAPHLGAIGRATQLLVAELEGGVDLERSTASSVFLGGGRTVGGWAIQLLLIAALLPFAAATVDLFARCRRRRVALAPALHSYGRRLGFWLALGTAFAALRALGAWPTGDARPPAPWSAAATDWPFAGLVALALVGGAAWLVARDGLLPRRAVGDDEELAGYTAALLVLGVLALVVVVLNPYALLLLLPSLHAWLWLPNVRARRAGVRFAVLACGLVGPALVLGSVAWRFGLGGDAPWYLLLLVATGYVAPLSVVAVLVWAAAAAQLVAVAAHRYAPAPTRRERPRGVARRVGSALARGRRPRRPSEGEEELVAEL